jgi:DNA-binding LacI/PurR family transcriptional regulator
VILTDDESGVRAAVAHLVDCGYRRIAYVEVAGRPIEPRASDASVVEQVILGARTWVADVAAVATPTERQRMLAFFDANLGRLRARLGGPPR